MIHSFFIPSLGVQRYAIPGRTIETWFRPTSPASFMANATRSAARITAACRSRCTRCRRQEFNAWLAQAKTKFSDAARPSQAAPDRVASHEVQH